MHIHACLQIRVYMHIYIHMYMYVTWSPLSSYSMERHSAARLCQLCDTTDNLWCVALLTRAVSTVRPNRRSRSQRQWDGRGSRLQKTTHIGELQRLRWASGRIPDMFEKYYRANEKWQSIKHTYTYDCFSFVALSKMDPIRRLFIYIYIYIYISISHDGPLGPGP